MKPRYLKVVAALGALAAVAATSSSATAAPASRGKAPFRLLKVGAPSPAPAWASSYTATPPAALGSPDPQASAPRYFTWVAGKTTALQPPTPRDPDTPSDQWGARLVNGIGEVTGSAHYCCFGAAPVRWAPSGVPTVLWDLYYSDQNGSRWTSALNDSGATVVQTYDQFDVSGELVRHDGARRALGTCSASDLTETGVAAGTCYVGDPFVAPQFPAVFDGFGDPQELPVPAGAVSTDCVADAISASGVRVVGHCNVDGGSLGIMWSGPVWTIDQTWEQAAFRARDVNDAGAMLGKLSNGQWARRVSGTTAPLNWQGKRTNQRLLDGVRYDRNGVVNVIVASTSRHGTTWQAAQLMQWAKRPHARHRP